MSHTAVEQKSYLHILKRMHDASISIAEAVIAAELILITVQAGPAGAQCLRGQGCLHGDDLCMSRCAQLLQLGGLLVNAHQRPAQHLPNL